MNSKKFKDALYEHREVTDIKDLINSSAELYENNTAFLVKKKHSEPFQPITYGRFKKDIDYLGTSLVHMGLKDKRIAVIGENSYEWVVSYFAVTMGTGVVVPIDRELKAPEIANLLNRSGAEALIYSRKMEKTIKEVLPLTETIQYHINMNTDNPREGELAMMDLIDEGRIHLRHGERGFVDAEIDPEQMAALLFTSGTTGMAKGVMLSHRNIVANVYNMSKYVDVDDEIGLSVLPMHHTYEMTCHIFTGLYQGITIAICEGLRYIQSNIQELHANTMLAVPLIFEALHKRIFKTAEATGKLPAMLKMIKMSRRTKLYNKPHVCKRIFKEVHEQLGGNIKHFIVGGAAINPRVIEDFEAMGFPIFQGYGMTENAPIIAVNKDRYGKAASAGLPMPGTEVKIIDVDETGNGEIICRGPSVMMGYFDDPEETAKVIQDGWLHTGDIGHFDKDGFLYVTGRKKSVIVTKNGKNVFPEEVEFTLGEQDYIAEALVHGIDSGTEKGIVIKAEIFPDYPQIEEEHGDLTDEEIHALIKKAVDAANDQMPPYKRVQRIGIRKTEFEKTTTRKIKRHNQANFSGEEEEDI